jgi:hypothetical protein
MLVSELFPSKFFKPVDIPAKGLALNIAKLEVEQVGQDRETKGVLYFRGEDKGLVLNKTNSVMIASFYGNNTDQWRDKVIILVREPTMYAGKPTEGIRIRQRQPKPPAAAPAAKTPQPEPPADVECDPGPSTQDAYEYEYRA